jgi:hypothetical protein
VRAPLWPLFHRSAGAQTGSVLAGTTGEGAALTSVRSVGVGSASPCGGGATGEGASLASVHSVGGGSGRHCGGVYDWCGRCSGLFWIVRRGLSLPLWWRARQVMALMWPLFFWSAWAQPATVVPGTTGESADLASVPLSAWAQQDTVGRARQVRALSGLFSLGRRGPRQTLWWQARKVRALLWPLFAR